MSIYRIWILLLILTGIFRVSTPVGAQVDFGPKAGISISPLENLDRTFSQQGQDYQLRLQEFNTGYHVGAFFRWQAGVLVIQPELLFDYYSILFSLDSLDTAGEPGGNLISGAQEAYLSLQTPLIINLKLGPVRVGGGPEGVLHLGSFSDMEDLPFYEGRYRTWSWGWEAGLGLDIWKLTLDLRIEGSLERLAYHQAFFDETGSFTNPFRRFLFQLGFRF
jgi:hypothetical protein